MLRDRYGSPRIEEAGTKAETSLLRASRAGVLAYAENDLLTMDTVLPDPHSVRALLAARNRVAANSLSQYKGLPPIDRNYGVCSRYVHQIIVKITSSSIFETLTHLPSFNSLCPFYAHLNTTGVSSSLSA